MHTNLSPGLLHVVTAFSNPVGWRSRTRLYRDFAAHVVASGAHLTTVECAYGERPFEVADAPGIHVGVRASGSSMCWNKENLLNIGVSRLPSSARYIGLFDADIRFHRADWTEATVQALQHRDVVQPWSDCYDLGPEGEHLEWHRSVGRMYADGQPIVQGPRPSDGEIDEARRRPPHRRPPPPPPPPPHHRPPPHPYRFAHPGFAWAYTRRALDCVGGMVETAALGAADHHMALALIGKVAHTIPGNLTQAYKDPLYLWQSRATRHIVGNIGYVPGTIDHYFHGPKRLRAYIDRWDILDRHAFDPDVDLRKNTYGVVELAGNKPGLRDDIMDYLWSRAEDSNTAE